MRRRKSSVRIALCGILAALALSVMFLGSVIPFASIACPVLASLVLIPVYVECGPKWGGLWYAATALLALMISPVKESGILFVFFGYYPMLRRFLSRLKLSRLLKFIYFNAALFIAYGLMLYVFRLPDVSAELAEAGKWMLLVMLLLANISFFLYDLLIARLQVVYHVRLRPKLKL